MLLRTERLFLRPIKLGDKESIYRYRSDAIANKYQSWIPQSIADVEKFIGKLSAECNQADTWFQLTIIEQKSAQIIGDLGIHFVGDKQCELGCTLQKQSQGRGFAKESMNAVIDYLFVTLNKHRVIASVDPLNSSSIHLMNSLKFRKEAHFKKSLWINEEWVDDVVYALLKSEWNME